MAMSEYWNNDQSKASGNKQMVLVPSSLPLVSRISIDSLMAHMSDYVYDKTSSSHIRHLVEVLCGEAGLGELLRQSVMDWLNGGVETAWLGFVDRLFAQVYGLPRVYSESFHHDVSGALLTTDELSEVLVKDAWYKARFVDLMQAMTCGGTVKGFKYAVRAITYDDCDIYETWRYRKQQFPVGRLGYTLYNEVVIAPYASNVDPKQAELLLRVLDRIKPADTVVTIQKQGLSQHHDYKPRSISATSSYFEVVRSVQNAVDNSKLPDIKSEMASMPYGWQELPNLAMGEKAEVRNYAQNHVQEAMEVYAYDKSDIQQIQEVTYSVQEGDELRKAEDWTDKDYDVVWSTWRRFELADSPDNYPGGKHGITPKHEPALAKDGQPYQFQYASQDEYEQERGKQILDSGGQVQEHMYRTVLSRTESSHTYLPEFALVQVNDVTGTLQYLPDADEQTTNSRVDAFHKEVQ